MRDGICLVSQRKTVASAQTLSKLESFEQLQQLIMQYFRPYSPTSALNGTAGKPALLYKAASGLSAHA